MANVYVTMFRWPSRVGQQSVLLPPAPTAVVDFGTVAIFAGVPDAKEEPDGQRS